MTHTFRFSQSRLMAVPLTAVWEVSGDPRRNVEWSASVRSVTRAADHYAVGESIEEQSVVAGPWTCRTTWTPVAIDPMRSRSFRGGGYPGIGELRPRQTFETLTNADGEQFTHVTYAIEADLSYGRLSSLVASALRSTFVNEIRESLESLERLCAGHRTVPVDVPDPTRVER
ncbi:SRPBCC family protein [Streptomyces sp. 2A115]|uniref:SRPBCC family protein n=1 Tax=Streptomyces sp. 2A115 TaxID=3457439 RepID=UPI003FD12530